ncbi:BstXI restriction endonuclease [Corynebacterium efficiens YS-314]|uniref:Uncharacterized protein n=1 Tax=Corynebacterium efficiens (strain DSM 44549 / YS-314 / AJ 12310 / JCM 11189 / NBRC 100395) TaxID=196164 RepID=Q8FTR7_COREF|nr:BstXI family restriction endonuclease [Corynebacterium efficiens]EEW51369.1 BstXI restriction endonuclease [Corynebacterium efficiens YS-314]BAC18304.1 hypothetical protein [Corynebacterium efficiens YS-314]
MATKRLPALPELLKRKIYKTGQTRGASQNEIYQNRVSRNSTVLIPYQWWEKCKEPYPGAEYENGFIVLIDPDWYSDHPHADKTLAAKGIVLGVNAVLHFQQRAQWDRYDLRLGDLLPNGMPFTEPTQRISPIGGTVLARIHGTTAEGDKRSQIRVGFNETNLRGAGIRVYEYASTENLEKTRLQLESYYWLAEESLEMAIDWGMSPKDARKRRDETLQHAHEAGLLEYQRLQAVRIVDEHNVTICPFCLERISASTFYERSEQAVGRETWDLTTTEISLFHIEELRVGALQHRPYNLGWGHHHCNIVVKDAGIDHTLSWVEVLLKRNIASGWRSQTSKSVPVDISTDDEASEQLDSIPLNENDAN